MVGRAVRAALCRLCRYIRRGEGIRIRRRRFRAGGRADLARSARGRRRPGGRKPGDQAGSRDIRYKPTGDDAGMKGLGSISFLICLGLPAAGALAQVQLAPPPGMPAPKASKPAVKPAKAKLIKAAKKPPPAP